MVDKIPPEGFVYVNVNIVNKGLRNPILVQKGCVFENNGGKYIVDDNGKLSVFDKSTNEWKDASAIEMTNYQWNAFRAVANNNVENYGAVTYSKKDIELAMKHYENSNFRNDLGEFLDDGYEVGSAKKDSEKNQVTADIKRNNKKVANLKFKIAEVSELKAASARFHEQATAPATQPSSTVEATQFNDDIDENSSTIDKMLAKLPYRENKDLKCAIPNVKALEFTYTAQQGEGYYSIARKFGVDAKALMAYNGVNPSNASLELNQEIKIPKVVYQVQQKDNLYSISKKFGVEEDILAAQNKIEDINQISVGQMIELPADIYTVKPKDNLNTIAKNAGIDVNALMKANGLASTTIHPDQKLFIFYNRADYNIAAENKTTTVDDVTNEVIETTDYSSENPSLKTRPHIAKVKRVKGKVVPNEHVFKPTKTGPLSGKVIVVNAGHGYNASGGIDGGTPGIGGLNDEWIINYDNAMRLKDRLCAKGAEVLFIQGSRNLVTQRMKSAPYDKMDMFISVHVNATTREATQDRMQFYYRTTDVPKATWQNSKAFCESCERTFDAWIPKNEKNITEPFVVNGKRDYAQTQKGALDKKGREKRTGVLTLPQTKYSVPSMIWEVAFLSEQQGRARLKNENLLNKYCTVLAGSIENYFVELDKYTYTVKSGDNLTVIAQKHGVTVDALKQANGLKGSALQVGQKLRIPK